MPPYSFLMPFLFILFFMTACNKPQAPTPPLKPITLGQTSYQTAKGKDCGKMDDTHFECAEIKFIIPKITSDHPSLKSSLEMWAHRFISDMVAGVSEDRAAVKAAQSPEAIANVFKDAHRTWITLFNEPSPSQNWYANSRDTLLLNDGDYLTVKLMLEVYIGGAHGAYPEAVGTFQTKTGKLLTWDDFVTDKVRFQNLVEKKLREARSDLFKPENEGGAGYNFDETMPFKLPQFAGMTEEGLYFNYPADEIFPHAFGPSEFVIPFKELEGLLKIKH